MCGWQNQKTTHGLNLARARRSPASPTMIWTPSPVVGAPLHPNWAPVPIVVFLI